MLEGLTSQELTEIEAYSRIEADPEGEEKRKEQQRLAEALRLEKLKNPFIRAIEASNEHRSDP